MKTPAIIVSIVVLAVGILLFGAFRIWNMGSDSMQFVPPDSAPPADLSSSSSAAKNENYAPLQDRPAASAIPTAAAPTPEPVAPAPTPVPEQIIPPPETSLITNWEVRLNALLESNLEDSQVAAGLLELLPRLPTEGKIEATEHMVNLMPDESYHEITPLLTNLTMEAEVMDILISDLLARPEAVQLPLFLEIARNPAHPSRTDAFDYLELYLEENYGEDWNAWHAATVEYLKNNPE